MTEAEIANKTAEKLMRGWSDCPNPAPCQHCIAFELESAYARGRAEVAAAEERGRRAGIEERDALRAALGVLLDSVDYTSGACTVTEMVGAVLPMVVIVRARAALAPRGSGKENT